MLDVIGPGFLLRMGWIADATKLRGEHFMKKGVSLHDYEAGIGQTTRGADQYQL